MWTGRVLYRINSTTVVGRNHVVYSCTYTTGSSSFSVQYVVRRETRREADPNYTRCEEPSCTEPILSTSTNNSIDCEKDLGSYQNNARGTAVTLNSHWPLHADARIPPTTFMVCPE